MDAIYELYEPIKYLQKPDSQLDIIYLEAEVNYTRFYLASGKTILSSYTLKKHRHQLSDTLLVKVNRGLIVNSLYIQSFSKTNVTLLNNTNLVISRRSIPSVMSFFNLKY